MRKFLFFIAFPFLLISFLFSKDHEILFLSTPHSGTHWGLYCLCNLLEKQVIFNRGPVQVDIFKNRFIDHKNGFIYAAHNPKDLWIKKDGDKEDILILILRNYKECLVRIYKTAPSVINQIKAEANFKWLDKYKNLALIQAHDHYFNNLRCYDVWNPSKRFLIYYEDLLENPEKVLYDLTVFFNLEEKTLDKFLQNLNFHIKTSLGIFNAKKKLGGSQSKGKDILYHSKKIGRKNCILIDSQVKSLFPNYFEKYLKRYETN